MTINSLDLALGSLFAVAAVAAVVIRIVGPKLAIPKPTTSVGGTTSPMKWEVPVTPGVPLGATSPTSDVSIRAD
jgi:hypothetical protein